LEFLMRIVRSFLPPLLLASLILLSPGFATATAVAKRSFFNGAAGTLPANPKDRAGTYFHMPQVRAIIEKMESGRLSEAEVAAGLAGSGATLSDLVRTRLIRSTAGAYVLGFNYFTLADMRRIHAVAGRDVPSLVDGYLRHAREFDRIFDRYPVKSVPRKRLATAVIAGVALNWDGLDRTMAWGYRQPQLVRGPGWKYSFFASENDPTYSEHGFIWGSSTIFGEHDNLSGAPVDFTFSSFGDPYSDPRMNFPDLFFSPLSDLTPDIRAAVEAIGPRDESYRGGELHGVLGPSRARSIGPMLFALRKAPQTAAALARYVEPADRAHAEAFLQLLIATDYIRQRRDGRYELIAPVLDRDDGPMLRQALALHRKILHQWLESHYPKERAQLSGLTAMREGVPFESLFTQIWHEYFGLATRQLVRRGFIEDPYSPVLRHPNSIAMVWRRSIYHFDPG
jgi:hypothetical protein